MRRRPTVCIVYSPGEEVIELGPMGLRRRNLADYEIWTANCIDPGTHVASSSSRKWANRIAIGLATSMRLHVMTAGEP